jgi:soluble lytic murein transglycosylase
MARPLLRDKWVDELLVNARGALANGDVRSAVAIARSVDDAFDANEDISQLGYDLRDDYTSLVWLGGTQSLWSLGDGAGAAPLFVRYGQAARTPGTRAKGFYWAGRAAAQAGLTGDAQRYFAMAARYADQFYGLLALERLGQPVPNFAYDSNAMPTPAERAQFNAAHPGRARSGPQRRMAHDRPLLQGNRRAAANRRPAHARRRTGARTGPPRSGVIVGQAAEARGFLDFQHIAFPLIPVPPGTEQSWTMIHAIARQESQFAQNAMSHVGARG